MISTRKEQTYLTRAREAHARADATKDSRDREVWRIVARTWEKLAGEGVRWSHKPLRRDLEALKALTMEARLEAEQSLAQPEPVRRETRWGLKVTEPAQPLRESVSIEF